MLALPRGGVPVGFEVSKALAAPLDVLLVRKIGAPGHEELGLGAVVDGHDPQLVLNEDLVRAGAPPAGYIETQERRGAVTRQAAQRWLDCGAGRIPVIHDDDRPALDCNGRAITGIVLSPAFELSAECNEVVCLATPDPFYAVGPHYRNFRQTEDAEVVRLLDEARQWPHR